MIANELINETENKSIRAYSVQEIIARHPGFIERWALIIYLFILILLFAGTWFIKYPDVIEANAILTGTNAPKEIVIRQNGKLVNLIVANDEIVIKGQSIGWIESTADHQEVTALSESLDSGIVFLDKTNTEKVSDLFEQGFKNLGELQPSYQTFITAWQQFNDYLVNGYYYKKKRILFEDYNFLLKMQQTIEQQIKLTQQDVQIAQEAFDANSSLYNDKVISKQDLREQKSKLVGKQLNLPQLESSLLSNNNSQTTKQKEIDELEHTISQQKTIFKQALQTLKSLTEEWKIKYIITAPVAGKVVFIIPLQENQFLQSGKIVGYINPPDSRYYAQVTLPQINFGKIDSNQKVQLRFDAYPYQEFGFIEGKLKYISKVPSDSGFLATINLPQGLLTNYNKNIQYRNGLKSQALIVTKETRLFQRFYYSIVKGLSVK